MCSLATISTPHAKTAGFGYPLWIKLMGLGCVCGGGRESCIRDKTAIMTSQIDRRVSVTN